MKNKEFSIGKEFKISTNTQKTYFNSIFESKIVELGDVYLQLCHEDEIVGGVLLRNDQIIATKDFVIHEIEFNGDSSIIE